MLGKIGLHRSRWTSPPRPPACSALQSAERHAALEVRRELEPVWVDADVTRIEQIVSNLVGNALKYTPAGGAITVRVAGRRRGRATVTDDGAGMPQDLVSRVFDPFVQGERALDRAQGGLGIGLTLVKRLAELHGGARERERATGQGAAPRSWCPPGGRPPTRPEKRRREARGAPCAS